MQSVGRKVKVCFIITKGVWGGAQKYVYSLATNLPSDTFEPVVITGAGEILKKRLEEKNILVYELADLKRDVSFGAEIRSFFKILKILYAEKPDVLHLNSPKAAGLGALAGRLLWRKNIIQTVHGFTWNEKRGLISRALVTFFTWVTMLLCHKTIVIAPQEEQEAYSLPLIHKEKIHLIRNGVDSIEFKSKDKAREEIAAIARTNNDDGLWIGTISELHKNKGLEFAIEAVSKIEQPLKFFIIGAGEEKATLERMIERKNQKLRVFLLGHIKNAPQYLSAFDVFTLTSVKEGLPYALLEAGLAALPTVASSVGGIPDIIENNTSGILVTKEKPGEITRALQYIIDNPASAQEYGENLQKKVLKDFSLSHMLDKTIELYRK